ncbi:hypothetical protein LUZ62_059776 [Rhynchospora pubera]|uniref:MULE transposase domain-containing protein n=1 Tax=Rhynchospora pubera TaxID=906938 RepID=A0AAV8E5H6_9POAL|nr:hypothetical protein LUZ62_059776 [Rhynchospora pubera]
MSNAGIQPRQILSSLRQSNPNTRAIAKTIYNERRKIQQENLKGKSLIQQLCEELGKGGFKFNLLQDEVGHITHLFFSHPQSITLTRNFPTVFVMDCTYNTNKYKMPLLDIVGITSHNTTFYSGFVFLKKESTEYHMWALQMFKETLQHENQPSVIMTDREQALLNAISIVFP